jgi:4-diphosphocytidyl-2-C-methyl-D-erythritol kinase
LYPQYVPQATISLQLEAALAIGASAEEIAPLLHNDLQEAAVSLRPELQKILDLHEQVYALTAIISGSGPTVAMLARDAFDAITIASRVRTYGYQAIVTSSPARPAQLVN